MCWNHGLGYQWSKSCLATYLTPNHYKPVFYQSLDIMSRVQYWYSWVTFIWYYECINWKNGCCISTHCGRVMHICISKQTIIGSDNGLSTGRRQSIIWTNAGILLIGPLGTKFNEILIEIHTFSFKKMHLQLSSGKWRPFCLGLNVLTINPTDQARSPNWTEFLVIL